jgi:hypothetical protein
VQDSEIARLMDRLRQVPAVRVNRVAAVRAELDADSYETPAKLDAAVDALIADLV